MLIILPCQSLEDLSLNRPCDESEQIIGGWTAMFHPALLEKLGSLPVWDRASYPMIEKELTAVLVPPCSEVELYAEWVDKRVEAGATIIRDFQTLDDVQPQLLDLFGVSDHEFDPQFVADIQSLGFCYLQIELLTRQLRYMSNLDEYQFETDLKTAIQRYRDGDRDAAEDKIRSAMDLLTESREYFYPVETHLLDILLTAPSTINDALGDRIQEWADAADAETVKTAADKTAAAKAATQAKEATETTDADAETIDPHDDTAYETSSYASETSPLVHDRQHRPNLFLPVESLETMARERPEMLAMLRTALAGKKVSIIGGEVGDWPLPLLPIEAVLRHLDAGQRLYRELLGHSPEIFARQRAGLIAAMPQLLTGLGYTGTLRYTFDGSLYSDANQSKIRWRGDDGTLVESLVRFPLDASRADTFMRLPETLGETMDLDHAATIVLAHWPGNASRWLDCIRNMARYSPALGAFTSIEQYFASTNFTGPTKSFDTDQYRSRYLPTAVGNGIADPISRLQQYHQRYATAHATCGLAMLTQLVAGSEPELQDRANWLIDAALDFNIVDDMSSQESADEHHQEQTSLNRELVERMANAMPKCTDSTQLGYLVVNPLSFSRRTLVDVSRLEEMPEIDGAVLLTRESNDRKWAVVELPPLGYAWIGPGEPNSLSIAEPAPDAASDSRTKPSSAVSEKPSNTSSKNGPKRSFFKRLFSSKSNNESQQERPLAEKMTVVENKIEQTQYVLRNDYFEVRFDPTTGALQSLHTFKARGNRLGQQLAMRLPEEQRKNDPRSDSDPNFGYSIMAADQIEIIESGPVEGRIRIEGRMLDYQGQLVARFKQTFTIQRANRTIEVDIELDPTVEPGDNPWDSYFAVRTAWSDATADILRNVNSGTHLTESDLLESPTFVEIQSPGNSTTVLTDGLALHRRIGLRQLDTVLITKGESARRFRLGYGIDLKYPVQRAAEFMTPVVTYPISDDTKTPLIPAPTPKSAWLIHLDVKNVIATDWQPIIGENGQLTGLRVRLLETEGRACDAGFSTFRRITSAQKTNYRHEKPTPLEIENESAIIPINARGLVQVEIELG